VVIAAIVTAAVTTINRNEAWCSPSRLWDPVIVMRPDDATALMNRSLSRLAAGDDDGARLDAAAAFDARPSDGSAAAMLGLLEVRAGHPEKALDWLLRAESLGTKTASVRGAKGDALRALGRHAEAAEAYERASRRSPSSERLALLHGLSLAESGNMEAASVVLQRLAAEASDPAVMERARECLGALPGGAGSGAAEP
jgi:Flp pilus assembly protein TadD